MCVSIHVKRSPALQSGLSIIEESNDSFKMFLTFRILLSTLYIRPFFIFYNKILQFLQIEWNI